MKGFLRVSVVLLIFFALVVSGQNLKKKGKAESEEEESEVLEAEITKKGSKQFPGRGGQCSCRDLDNQIEQLEFRLDRMIDLWNDFVDKNRNPYGQQQQEPYPADLRRPGQSNLGGGRAPYYPPSNNRLPQRPNFGGRSYMEEDQGQQGGARRYRF